MGEAFAWLGQAVEWFGQFIPRWSIINANMAGLKFVKGATMVKCEPGITFWWPVTTNLQVYPTARQTLDLRTQVLQTTDGRTVGVGGMVTYRVEDVELLLGKTWDADQTIKDTCAGVISEIVRDAAWPDLQTHEFEQELRLVMRKRLRPYGVRVMKATLTDCSPIRVYKLVNANSADVG